MAGWRLGYCVGNKEMVGGLAKIKGYYDYGIFSAIQVAGIVAMRDCDDTIHEQVAIYQKRRDVLCEGLMRMGWEVEKPGAGMFVWVRIPEPYATMGSVRFAIEMMNRAHVAVAPGAGFGEDAAVVGIKTTRFGVGRHGLKRRPPERRDADRKARGRDHRRQLDRDRGRHPRCCWGCAMRIDRSAVPPLPDRVRSDSW